LFLALTTSRSKGRGLLISSSSSSSSSFPRWRFTCIRHAWRQNTIKSVLFWVYYGERFKRERQMIYEHDDEMSLSSTIRLDVGNHCIASFPNRTMHGSTNSHTFLSIPPKPTPLGAGNTLQMPLPISGGNGKASLLLASSPSCIILSSSTPF